MMGELKVRPDCVNASNPFHVCADNCARRSPNPRNGRNVDPDCVNASNPFHQCADYCTKKKIESETGNSAENGESIKGGARKMEEGMQVDPMFVNSSDPFHQCNGCCSQRNAGERKSMTLVQNGDSYNEEVRKMEDRMKVDPTCVHSSDPFHQCNGCCSQRNAGERKSMTLGALLARESAEDLASGKNRKKDMVIRGDKKFDPRCPNASYPLHECAEYCLQKIGESGRSEGSKSDRSKGCRSAQSEGGKSADRSKRSSNIVMDKSHVDPRCVNASNPFHKCADYCLERIHESS